MARWRRSWQIPAAARATPLATAALTRLGDLAGTVAVITGRPAADAAAFAGVPADSNVLVLGHYGRQRWERGRVTGPPAPAWPGRGPAELPAVLAAARAEDAWVEDKGEALAVHTRRAAEPQAEFERLDGAAGRASATHRADPGTWAAGTRASSGRCRQGQSDPGPRGRPPAGRRSCTAATTWAIGPPSRRCRELRAAGDAGTARMQRLGRSARAGRSRRLGGGRARRRCRDAGRPRRRLRRAARRPSLRGG